jgi:hypothetical protein
MQQTPRQQRQQVRYQFEMQLRKLGGLEIRERYTCYRYLLHDEVQQRERKAMILSTSWDFYEYRVHRSRWKADLLIVQRHNAVVPCAVLELETGIEHRPGKVPDIERPQRIHRNHEEVLLFVSKLLIGLEGAYTELRGMPPRTRQYYTALAQRYLRPRVGRPWAS